MRNINTLRWPILIMVLLGSIVTHAQQTFKAFFIGHSLTDQIPDMVESLALDHPNTTFDWVFQSIPGAPLFWNWDHGADFTPTPPHYYGYNHAQEGLPNGSFSHLILTESVPRHYGSINDTYEYAANFYEFARNFNPNVRVYIYEVWHCLKSGTPTACDWDIDSDPWRERLSDDLSMWESVVDYLNTTYEPEIPVCLIPGGQGLARLYDEIALGTVPGVDAIDYFFSDDIHLTDVGKYFMACIHFATLFNTSPVGLTNQLQVWWGGDFEAPTPEMALRLQQIAWETVQQYANHCPQTMKSNSLASNKVFLYPNPTSGDIHLHATSTLQSIRLFDITGKTILVDKSKKTDPGISLAHLQAGVYFIEVQLSDAMQTFKIIKQ